MMIDIEKGWLQQAIHIPTDNFNDRPEDQAISLIVIHNISLPPGEFGTGAIEDFFTNQLDASKHPYFQTISHLQVSAHLLIERDGTIKQFVSLDKRAWHAGQSQYLGQENCNDFSIGIELEGTDDTPYTQQQYECLTKAVLAIQHAYPHTINALAGHSDIAPLRKTDPGSTFEWENFRTALAIKFLDSLKD